MNGNDIALELRGVIKSFGDHLVLNNIDLSVRRGEILALLGPSGCGKSTTLNIIAGFFPPDTGEVLLAGKKVTAVPPHKRNVGMVFQNYSLFPHLNAFDNVAFGLAVRHYHKAEIRERVMWALDLVKLPDVHDRFPAQLSGGQQQRVAFARALVLNPQVLLTDEPFSNLDALLRRDMQLELKRIQMQTGVTMIHVTHDQEEAIILADRVALLSQGKIDQLADPQTIFEHPRTVFGAEFMGYANIMPGQVVTRQGKDLIVQLDQGGQLAVRTENSKEPRTSVAVCIREERVKLGRIFEEEANFDALVDEMDSDQSILNGKVDSVIFTGASYKIFVTCKGGHQIRAQMSVQGIDSLLPHPGEIVQVHLPRQDLRIVECEGDS